MKKIMIFGIIIIFLLTSFNGIINAGEQNINNKISVAYVFESPLISKIDIDNIFYDSITIEGAPCDGNPGEPMLPGKGAYILHPPNSKVKNIIVNPGPVLYLGSGYLLEPAGKPVPLSDIDNAKIPVPDEKIYSSNELFPRELYSEIGTYGFRGYNILVLRLNPVQYIPATGELFYYPELTVNVETINEEGDNSLFRGLHEDNNKISGKVDNTFTVESYSEMLQAVPYHPLGEYDLLIITSNSLKSGFEPLKQVHDSRGVKTMIYTVEDIYNNYPGVDDAEKIRNFIKHAYNTYGIEYVLLGGDHEIVPARYLYSGNWLGNLPSDLYYAGLDGDWNLPETPNPSHMDISVEESGVKVSAYGDFVGPTIDYSNYMVGDSSMRFDCKPEKQSGLVVIEFDDPIDLSNDNYLRFYINYSRPDLIKPWEMGSLTGMLISDSIYPNYLLGSFTLSDPTSSWENMIVHIRDNILNFNFQKVSLIFLFFNFNQSSSTPSGDDYIRLDGIYFSDSVDLLWGEPGGDDDLFAEVYVGRACVDDLADVANFTSKTISYMNIDKDDSYLKNVSMVGEYMGAFLKGKWGGNSMDELIGKCGKHGYITQGFPEDKFNIDKLYDRNWRLNGWPRPGYRKGGWPKEEIIYRINQGTHVINHLGHADNLNIMKMNNSDVINFLTNEKLCFIYSQGCYAGSFDNMDSKGYYHEEDSIAEHFTVKTDNGAFAGIWNARFGYGKRFSTNGPSQSFHRQFWDAVFSDNITVISKANQASKEANIWRINLRFIGGIHRGLYYGLNYFGDPSLQFKYLDSSLTNSQSQTTPQSQLQTQQSSQTSIEISGTTTTRTTTSYTTITK